jgi:hypothetical protein
MQPTWTFMRARWLLAVTMVLGCTSPNGLHPGGGGNGGTGGGGGAGSGGGGGAPGTPPGTIEGGSGLLKFAVFGDARPKSAGGAYPSAILSSIFTLMQSHGAQFAIGTGDYMYADNASQVAAQVPLFQQAQAGFTNPIYLAMGNHECTGFTDSNCPNLDETANVQAYMKMLPSGVTLPYYRMDWMTPSGKAKFLFVAANAWSSAEETWLQAELADPTTYTFVIRHEPQEAGTASTAPGVAPSESLLGSAKYTLELLGHSHEYKHVDTQHVISGNAGAPITTGSSYGFLMIEQGSDGNLTATEIDEATAQGTDTWKITPDGKTAF